MERSPCLLRRLLLAAVAWSSVCLAVVAAAEKGSAYRAAMESITGVELQNHVAYLASDALEGRESGTRGGLSAANYLVSRLNHAPFHGGAADGGFFQVFTPNYRNVLVRLEGSDPELKHQYIVIGAHYDHIGYGARASLDGYGQIHNGADDNASGTSGVLELADAFATLPEAPRRSILFVFWDAEEKGLLGSKHWVAYPTVPLPQVAAMLNLDMIGRVRGDRLLVLGTRSAYGLRRLASLQNREAGLLLDFPWKMAPEADHYPFFERGIPVLMFNTDLHEQYHRATDDAQLINTAGMQQVARLMFGIAYQLANNPETLRYRTQARHELQEPRHTVFGQTAPMPERLGIACERQTTPARGVRLTQVTPGSPAQRGGLAPEDRIVQFDQRTIQTSDELAQAVASAENPVSVVIERPGQPQPLKLTLNLIGGPMRLGITWRLDEAEPGTVILTYVAPNSPAAQAGLEVGDRVYQIAGQDFANDTEFARLAKTLPGPIRLMVERRGRIRIVEIPLDPQPVDRSA